MGVELDSQEASQSSMCLPKCLAAQPDASDRCQANSKEEPQTSIRTALVIMEVWEG